MSFVKDPHLASELTQEAFLQAYSRIESFKHKSTFYTWVYRIAINLTKTYLAHKNYRAVEKNLDDAVLNYAEYRHSTTIMFSSAEDEVVKEEIEEKVYDLIETLPEELRLTIILRELAGLQYDEIAIIMQCPVGTVRSRVYRAKHIIDDLLGE